MEIIFLYIIDIADNTIFQYGSSVGRDGVPRHIYKHFRQTISLHLEWEEGEKPHKILKYLR